MHRSSFLQSLSLYKYVFSKTLDPSIIFDKKSNINYVNESFLEIGGYDFKKIIGENIDVLVPEEERNRVRGLINKVLKNETIFREFNTFLLTKNKKKIPVALTIFPLIEKKILIGGLAFFVDIRQLQGLLDGLNRAKSELEERVKERTKELEKKTLELKKVSKALEEAKIILEIKVKARTKELEELNNNLEEKIKQRTLDLQERLDELNRWYNITVGRELKMVELKKEIEKIKKKRKNEPV